ncbi:MULTISPECIES: hypothetical protein [Citrobacter freundii complex]|uniref:hypothetical protein n=1 Tax=Citrobacter freundii complex TaxID=1344959 RepID=UPI0025438456|nr:hypothetical protein [Citrobacter portucalensis]WII76282.1 hypothetical protein N5860_20940 [Citrobacter portucalensis]
MNKTKGCLIANFATVPFIVAASGAASALDENGTEIALLNTTAEPIFAAVVTVSRREICIFKISFSLFFIISTLIASKEDLNLHKIFTD